MDDVVELRALTRDNLYPDLVDWAILTGFKKSRICTVMILGVIRSIA